MATGIQLTPPPRRRDPLVEALMGQASDSSPKGHPREALAQAVQGFMAGKMQHKATTEAESQEKALAAALMSQFNDGSMQTADMRMAPEAVPASLMQPPGALDVAPAPMGQQVGDRAMQAPAAAPDGRPPVPALAQALMQAGNRGGANQVLAQALLGQEAPTPTTSQRDYAAAQRDPEFAEWLDRNRAEGQPSAREARIADTMQTLGVARDEAVKLTDGLMRLTTDDKGNRVLTDLSTGRSRLLEIEAPAPPPRMERPPATDIDELSFDPGEGTGFGATFLGAWNSTFGQIPILPIAQGPEEAAQKLRILERDAIRALASSGRPPVVEQERIIAALPRGMEWFENPEVATFKAASFVDLMVDQYIDDLRFRNDPTNPKDGRDAASERSRQVEGIIRRMLTEDAANQLFQYIEGGGAQPAQAGELPPPPEGISPILWQNMTDEERALWP